MSNVAKTDKVWLVTGASTGFGRELVEYLLTHGARVVATARKIEALKDLGAQYPERVLVAALTAASTCFWWRRWM